MLVPGKGKKSSTGDDDRGTHVAPDEPKIKIRKGGKLKKKTVLLGREEG